LSWHTFSSEITKDQRAGGLLCDCANTGRAAIRSIALRAAYESIATTENEGCKAVHKSHSRINAFSDSVDKGSDGALNSLTRTGYSCAERFQ